MSWPPPLLRQINQRLLHFPRGHITRRYMSWRFCKQYRRLKEYIQDVLLLRQPEVYINTIFSFQSVQLFITWKRANTKEICQYDMFLNNSPGLAKLVSHHMRTFDNIVNVACSFGTSPYADLFI